MVTQAMGRIDEMSVKAGGVQCAMTFMVVDTDSYDVLLGLDFLIKIGAIVDVERGLIQEQQMDVRTSYSSSDAFEDSEDER
ncbi:unnamed protein product [Sphagnum jensenii]